MFGDEHPLLCGIIRQLNGCHAGGEVVAVDAVGAIRCCSGGASCSSRSSAVSMGLSRMVGDRDLECRSLWRLGWSLWRLGRSLCMAAGSFLVSCRFDARCSSLRRLGTVHGWPVFSPGMQTHTGQCVCSPVARRAASGSGGGAFLVKGVQLAVLAFARLVLVARYSLMWTRTSSKLPSSMRLGAAALVTFSLWAPV